MNLEESSHIIWLFYGTQRAGNLFPDLSLLVNVPEGSQGSRKWEAVDINLLDQLGCWDLTDSIPTGRTEVPSQCEAPK